MTTVDERPVPDGAVALEGTEEPKLADSELRPDDNLRPWEETAFLCTLGVKQKKALEAQNAFLDAFPEYGTITLLPRA